MYWKQTLKVHAPQIVYTLASIYSLYRYIWPKVYTIWAHGPFRERTQEAQDGFLLMEGIRFIKDPWEAVTHAGFQGLSRVSVISFDKDL